MSEDVTARPHLFSMYDAPFWDSVAAGRMALQRCTACGTVRYPPGPACPHCLAPEHEWRPVSGAAELLSWTVFHRAYLPAWPAPHAVLAVRLAEGPVMVAMPEAGDAAGLRVGMAMRLGYAGHPDGYRLPVFRPA